MKRPLRFSMSLSILFLSPMSAIVSAAVDIPLSLSSEKNYIVEVVLPGGSRGRPDNCRRGFAGACDRGLL